MGKSRILSRWIVAALLASAGLGSEARAADGVPPARVGQEQFGAYLTGRAAQRRNDWQTASAAMARALGAAPAEAELRHSTLLLAIAAGDIATAARVAATTPQDSNDTPIAALTLAVDRLAQNDLAGARRWAEAMPSIGITHLARPLLLARLAVARGDAKAARDALNPLFEHEATRDLGEVEAAHLDDKAKLPQAVARGLSEFAGFLAGQQQLDPALLLARLSLRLVPDEASALTRAAEALARQGRPREALALYDAVPAASGWAAVAARGAVDCLQALDRPAEARARAEAAATSKPDDVDARLKLGDLLRKQRAYAEAVAAYDRALSMLPADSPRRWIVLYARGAARERAGDWAGAETDLLQSLSLKPETPTLLNFLGFAWAERGVNLDRARELLERAVQLAPEDGAVADSLGWTLYRQGDFPHAVAELERAVALQPGDGVINDHLGDAYWRVGRTREAEFQWARAVKMASDPGTARAIEAKLQDGLAAVDIRR
jgi:tetratricopeptide (TPR) repeat protein